MIKKRNATKLALVAGATAVAAFGPQVHADSSADALINKLEQKGILTSDEARELRSESEQTETNLLSQIPASKWQIASAVKTIGFYGDLRLRYEYRGADNPWPNPAVGSVLGSGNTGVRGNTYARERFRYALRIGLRGDLLDDWSYGVRLDTSANPRSQFVTFGDDTGKSTALSGTPFDKSSDSIYVGQAYLGWHPTSWFEMMAGKMPQPLYTTPLVWSSSINPEGAFEKFKTTIGPVDLFVDAAQYDYQDPSVYQSLATSDTFMLAQQIGVNVRFGKTMSFKVAPVVYIYTGHGNSPGPDVTPATYTTATLASLYFPFVGQGDPTGLTKGMNVTYNQNGLDDLEIVECPAEFNVKIMNTPLGNLQARIFGDIAYNYKGDDRARAAFAAAPAAFPGSKHAITGQNVAYQVGIGLGSEGPVYGPTQGLVYGSASRKHNWEVRFYWQSIDQYALDVNLLDADFFEGRANMQGFYTSVAYCFSDAIIGTLRYGSATRINNQLGTGGNNPDLFALNPVTNYQIVQADLTYRF